MGKISFPGKILFLFCVLFISHRLYGFRVVIDPGHGGRFLEPVSIYGDKYDPDTARFMEGYRPGASITGLNENEDVYEISLIVKDILDLTLTEQGRRQFYQILKKYDPTAAVPKEPIEVLISRNDGYRSRYWEIDYDINRDYRLYDHDDLLSHDVIEGVISRINALKPDLVVSLHLTGGNPGKNGGMASVITPSFNIYHTAIDYVNSDERKRKTIKKTFSDGPYGKWFISQHGRTTFEWFLCDAWIYFTGYWPTIEGLDPDLDKFRGYRQNMITWNYRDEDWLDNARSNAPNTAYANHLKYFNPQGKFWEREKSEPEMWRRDGGPEGYGGDNLYASQEILRFIRKGLVINSIYSLWNLPEIVTPYISTWSVPTYVNAISAFLELAYLDNKNDFNRIVKYKKIHAEAIAIGIYSLMQGTKSNDTAKQKKMPWGKPLNLDKYKTYNNSNYFEMVRD